MDSLFIEGRIQAPLSALQPQEQSVVQAEDLAVNLRKKDYRIICLISIEARDFLLRKIKLSGEELRAATDPPLIENSKFMCMHSRQTLEQAKEALGDTFLCQLELYCVPPNTQKSCDGDVFRSIRYHMKRSDRPRSIAVAQAWMDTLSASKKHVLSLMLRREHIIRALDSMLPFPGVWNGLQLGNWAKHLAAHLDTQILSYWAHLKTTWEAIMLEKQHLYHLVTAEDVARLQYRAPTRSKVDRQYIQQAFSKFELFKGIGDSSTRSAILNKILSLDCIIPSIKTFHQNMRYITIGAKVLEKTVQSKNAQPNKKDTVEPVIPSLFENLKKDWRPSGNKIEVSRGSFAELSGAADPYLAFLVLFVAALRDFPHLSSEKPLLDLGKQEILSITSNMEYKAMLCTVAKELGFLNSKIEKGIAGMPRHHKDSHIERPNMKRDWRAGTPPLLSYLFLEHSSFIHRIYSDASRKSDTLDPLFVQSDLIRSFFPYQLSIPESLTNNTPLHFEDTRSQQPSSNEAQASDASDDGPWRSALRAVGTAQAEEDVDMTDAINDQSDNITATESGRSHLSSRATISKEARPNRPRRNRARNRPAARNSTTIRAMSTLTTGAQTQQNIASIVDLSIPSMDATVAPLEVGDHDAAQAQKEPENSSQSNQNPASATSTTRPIFNFSNKIAKNAAASTTTTTWGGLRQADISAIIANLRGTAHRSDREQTNIDTNTSSRASEVDVPDALQQGDFGRNAPHEFQLVYPSSGKEAGTELTPSSKRNRRGIRAQHNKHDRSQLQTFAPEASTSAVQSSTQSKRRLNEDAMHGIFRDQEGPSLKKLRSITFKPQRQEIAFKPQEDSREPGESSRSEVGDSTEQGNSNVQGNNSPSDHVALPSINERRSLSPLNLEVSEEEL